MSTAAAESLEQPRTTTAWPLVFLLFLAGVAVAFQIGKVPGALPFLKADLGLSLFVAGWVVSMLNILAGVGGGLFGTAADWAGHRRLALAGLIVTAVAGAAGSVASSPALLLATRAVEGLGFILTTVSIPPLMLALSADRDRSRVMGLWGAYMPTGMGAMLFLSGPLLTVVGWRDLWLITSALIAVVALLIALLIAAPARREGARPAVASALADFRLTVLSPGPVLLGAVFATYAAQYLIVMAFLPLLLIDGLGVVPATAAMLGAVAVAANVIGNLASGVLLDRGFSRSGLIIGTSAVMALMGAVIFLDWFGLGIRFAAAIVLSAVGGLIPGALFAGAPVHAPRPGLVASVSGLLMQGAALGQLVGPPAAGWLVSAAGNWSAAIGIMVLSAGLTCCSAFALGRIEARQANDTKARSASSSSSK